MAEMLVPIARLEILEEEIVRMMTMTTPHPQLYTRQESKSMCPTCVAHPYSRRQQ